MLSLHDRVLTLGNMVVNARLHFDLWSVTKSDESWLSHKATFDAYWQYLRFNREAHERAFVLGLASILDKPRNDLITLRGVSDELHAVGLMGGESQAELRTIVARHTKTQRGVILLRHKLFAHRDSGWTYRETWKRANLTTDNLRSVFVDLIDVANVVLESDSLVFNFRLSPYDSSSYHLD